MADQAPPDLSLPVLLLGLAVAGWLGFTTVQLLREGGTLSVADERQGPAVQEGDRVRQQLESLLSGATELANGGNGSARAALEALQNLGVAYTPPH